MKTKFFFILVFCAIIVSCSTKNSNIKYYYLTDVPNPKIEISLFDSLEDGLFKVSSNKESIVMGEFEKGRKVGVWFYNKGVQHDKIMWKDYQCDDGVVSLQYPDSWLSIPFNGLTFQATFDTIPHIDSNYYFRIIRNKITGGVTIFDYSKLLVNDISSNRKIISIQRSLVKNETKEFVYSYIKAIKRSDTLLIMSFVTIIGREYFDVLYSTNNDNADIKEQLFYDVISSIKFNNRKVINNQSIIKVYKLKYR
jgi:hypothetical protein